MNKKIVLVSGCFDVLHSGHVEFLQRAADYGALHVSVGSDATVMQLKGRPPVIPERERAFLVGALRSVESAFVASGVLPIDYEPDMERLRPDYLVVNADGMSGEKRAICERHGVELVVLERLPADGLAALSTTSLRSADLLPYRVELCGGWGDLPDNSARVGGAVVTVSLVPREEYAAGGMAGSTRKKAAQLWGGILPGGDPVALAHQLFCCDNPPGTAMVSGPQDAIGLCCPGVSLMEYAGQWWPTEIRRDTSIASAGFLERNLRLVQLPGRGGEYNPLGETRFTEDGLGKLAAAARACWEAIQRQDAGLLGWAFNQCREAQEAMLPRMFRPVEEEITSLLGLAGNVKLSGAGGGGLAVMATNRMEPGWIVPRVRL